MSLLRYERGNPLGTLALGIGTDNQPYYARVDASGKLETAPAPVVGGPAAPTVNKTIAVGVASVLALAANPTRTGAAVVNNGNVDMYLGLVSPVTLGSSPSATGGSLIRRGGGAWDPKGYAGPVYLISSGAGTVAGVQEW